MVAVEHSQHIARTHSMFGCESFLKSLLCSSVVHMMLCIYIEYIITFLNNNLGVACQNVSPVVDLVQSNVMQLLLLPQQWLDLP